MKRYTHNLSHHRLATSDMGYLVPVACLEVLMGDSFRHWAAMMLRVAPLAKPVMHPVDVRIHHWFVPNRIVWDDWDDFITGKQSINIPTISYTAGSSYQHNLVDHFGIPDATLSLNALPFRAYNKIYNEFYRDQDLVTEVAEDSLTTQKAAWEKDYFTSARASAQQGSAIAIPFSAGSAPVKGIATYDSGSYGTGNTGYTDSVGDDTANPAFITGSGAVANNQLIAIEESATSGQPNIRADLSNATGGISIEEFRLSMALQRHREARRRYGSRIQDYLAYHGIRPRDGRLDIPEYLGGGKNQVSFSEVLSTSDSGTKDVGDFGGHGIATVRSRPYNAFFAESGHVISIASVRPRTLYANQLHRMWTRTDRFSLWQKELEELGPQAVYTREVYGSHGNGTDVFGYQGRHDDYRRHPSYITGQFRNSSDEDWHMARILSASPTLNQSFVESDPTDRIYLDTNEPELRMMVAHNVKARRMVRGKPKH